MAEIRINTTGGLKLYDADNSHYAQIVAGTITSNVDAITLGHNLATFNAAVTATGILKTDDTTEATSTTDGSLQTDGGLSVAKDAIIGDDLKLLSDSAVLSLGAGSDITFTHDGTTGLTIAATPISIDSTGELHLNSTTGDIKLQDGGTDQIAFDLDGTAGEVIMKPAVDSDDLVISQYDGTEVIRIEDNASLGLVGNKLSIANSSSDVIIKPLTDAKDIIFQQYDGTVVATVEDNATFNIPASKLAIGGTAVTATAAELNLLDGGTSVGSSITLADADGVVVNDGGTMKTIPASDIATYAGGLWVKLGDTSFSGNTATVTFDNVFSSTYRVYKVHIKSATSNSDEQFQIKFRSGASGSNADIDESDYSHHRTYNGIDTDNGNSSNGYSNSKANQLFVLASQGHMGSNHKPMQIDMTIQDPGDHASDNSGRTQIVYNAAFYNNANLTYHEVGSCFYDDGTDPTGIKFSMSAGSFGYGNFLLYGLKP